eukprot:TRINITY_DN68156_c5_g1_i10.p1 TRINITY_DN68156_c5_g1~~TRINITY_DN68156_c5_g1_i10.p1  ORF type:complete len:310 (-),score=5.22 TRINITY_DN68156_c5_g1_i10:385-1293(-)
MTGKLGVAYNVFDGEELLESSIKSIKSNAAYVVVVYQTTSNFGAPCRETLVPLLQKLKSDGLIDDLVEYTTVQDFDDDTKRKLISKYACLNDVGGSVLGVADQFLNELCKRNIGLQKCREAGCDLFMSMDTDEFYKKDQLAAAKEFMMQHPGYGGLLVKIRYFYKYPTVELTPLDAKNHVPMMYRITPESKLLLAHPYPVLIDPTRGMAGGLRVKVMDRKDCEMYHYSFVRCKSGIKSKLENVSNKANYNTPYDKFFQKFSKWEPDHTDYRPPLPHPAYSTQYSKHKVVDNWFEIPDVWAQD